MKKLNEVDKAVLRYHNISYIIEAYKIFYGKYPINDNGKIEYKKIKLMMFILSEYKIKNIEQIKDINCYDDNVLFSNTLNFKCNILEDKIKNICDKEKILEQICNERPLSEIAKNDIKLISYMINQQIEKEEIKDSIEFLKQLCNILFYRNHAILTYCGSYEQQVDEMAKGVIKNFKKIEYQQDMIEERINFIVSKLRLCLKPQFGENTTESIFALEKITTADLSEYSGLLLDTKNKTLIK